MTGYEWASLIVQIVCLIINAVALFQTMKK